MALPVRKQAKYWGIAAAVFFVILWTLGDVILPFVLGAAIAYFLDPVADRLERLGVVRTVALAILAFKVLCELLHGLFILGLLFFRIPGLHLVRACEI